MGIDPTANERAIKSAYRKLALQFHPDKNKDGEEKFKAITAA
jgi:DnaJ-class molecular chaperone